MTPPFMKNVNGLIIKTTCMSLQEIDFKGKHAEINLTYSQEF